MTVQRRTHRRIEPQQQLRLLWLWLFLGILFPAHGNYVKRYSTVANGGMTYIGNALGLDKVSDQNNPGTSGSIGAFISTNTSLRVGTSYPLGTTLNWTNNSSSAVLTMPAGSTVIYAELIWSGSYNYGGQNISAFYNRPVKLTTPLGTYSVSQAAATAVNLGTQFYYVRSADVTDLVRAAANGTYIVAGVPATVGASENNANVAGWTLAIIYGNASLPSRNMTVFVGAEMTDSANSTLSSVSGFCTPSSGIINARMFVSVCEGDASITGDQMQFGPTSSSMVAVSGPNNPIGNFFCGQINGDNGQMVTTGTFGTRNHAPGAPVSGARQGWDITSIDVSARMLNNQNSAYAKGTTTSDRYVINSIGLQINVGAPVFPTAVMSVDKTNTYIGDTLTYTLRISNTNGSADAINVMLTAQVPNGTSYIPNTFTTNGVLMAGANPVMGVPIPAVAVGTSITVTFKVKVNSAPPAPALAQFNATASWTYQYQSCSGYPLNNGVTSANVVSSILPRLEVAKSANPASRTGPGAFITYTITAKNSGNVNTTGATLQDSIPPGTTYIAGSTTLNGVSVQDVGGQMPFVNAAQINSSGRPSGQINTNETATISFRVQVDANPPIIISNIAYIDPDGPGPSPAQQAVVTNPPIEADFGVGIADNTSVVVAGTPLTYYVNITNYGPDSVVSLYLSLSLPPQFVSASMTPSAGSYDSASTLWSGLTLSANSYITLTIPGSVSPTASSNLVLSATVIAAPGNSDTNSLNNVAADTNTISSQVDLSVTKTAPQSSVVAGGTINYTITVSNNGPSTITSLSLSDAIPSNVTNAVYAPSQGTYNEESDNWNGITLGPAQTVSLSLSVSALTNASGVITNIASVSPPSGVTLNGVGPAAATNWITISTLADIVVSKSGAASANAGSNVIYTISVTNLGPTTASNVVVMDALPPEANFVSASSGGSVSNNTVLWPAFVSLANGARTNLTVTLAMPASGTVTNTASATSSTVDPVAANNNGSGPSAQVVTTVTPVADIAVFKHGATNAYATANHTYTITVTNQGPSTASNLVVIDPIPARATFVSASGSGSLSNNVVVWPAIISFTNSASTNFTVTIAMPATGSVTNAASASAATMDSNSANNNGLNPSAQVITAVLPIADVLVFKTGPASVFAGTNVTYRIAITNAGPSTASNVSLLDTLPLGATFVSATAGGSPSNSFVVWPAFNLTNGAATNVSVVLTLPPAGKLTNTASASASTYDPTSANNNGSSADAQVITTVTPMADLTILKSGPTNVYAGTNIIYTLTLANQGPSTASNVTVFDALPSGSIFVSASGGGSLSNNTVVWSGINTLTNGAVTNFTVTVTPPASGILTNISSAASQTLDPAASNNDGSSSGSRVITAINPVADVAVFKNGATNIVAGNAAVYTITVTNLGPSGASNVIVIDTLPPGVVFVSASGNGSLSNNVVTWPVMGSLPIGGATNLTVNVTMPGSGSVTNVASATASTYDPNSQNNNGSTSRIITTITPSADLSVTKSGPVSANAGYNVIYTIAVTNLGPSTASNIVIRDLLPPGAGYVSSSTGGSVSNNMVIWPALSSLDSGARSNFTVTLTMPASGSMTNIATGVADTLDPNSVNNNGSATNAQVVTVVTPVADVMVFKSGETNASPGTNLTYAIIVTNQGPSYAINVAVFDTLPSGVTYISSSSGGSLSNNIVVWPGISQLAANAATNYTVTVTMPASGSVTNISSSISDTYDPAAANNNGSSASSRVVTTLSALADVATTKSGPAFVTPGTNITYTITVKNQGPSAAVNVVVRDQLPSGMTMLGASGGGSYALDAVSWPAMTLTNGEATNFTISAMAPLGGVFTNKVASTADTPDPVPGNNDGTAPGAIVISTVIGVTISGWVYDDANKNGQKNASENGLNLALYVKLINTATPAGPVLQAVAADPATGYYAMMNVTNGNYMLVLDDNNSLADVTPAIPAGWVGTDAPNQVRNNVGVNKADVPNQNFGLYQASTLTGTVFVDNGIGGGTPNDGIKNGAEAGLAGVTVKLTDASGGTVYDTTTTDGAGKYQLLIPSSVTIGAQLRVVEVNLNNYLSIGGSAGNTGGTYDRASDVTSFAFAAGKAYAGLNFGDVLKNQFVTDNQTAGLPGSVVFFGHTFTANSGGQLTFTVMNNPNPAITGWSHVIYRDANCNNILDAGDPLISSPITVNAGDVICVLIKEYIPVNAPFNAQDQITVTANFTYTAASPALAVSYTRNDLIIAGTPTTAGLNLTKAVDKATALPGQTLTYTITYANRSSEPLSNINIFDSTPAFTTFVSASADTLPPSLDSVNIIKPTAGSRGAIQWTFTGSLMPGSSGTILFSVTVE